MSEIVHVRDPLSSLAGSRDAVLKRWIGMEIEDASVEELAGQPLGERLRRLELLFDAALHEMHESGHDPKPRGLPDAIDEQIRRHRDGSVPFTLAMVGPPADVHDPAAWRAALAQAAGESVEAFDAGDGTAAVLLPAVSAGEAPAALDRLSVSAWSAGGGLGPLPGRGHAVCPDDGTTTAELLSAARDRVRRLAEATLDRPQAEASVTPLYSALS